MLQVNKVTLDLAVLNNEQTQTLTRRGNTYYVNATGGVDTRSGKSWRKSFATMAKAFSVIVSGDTIVFAGKIREQIVTPANVFDVTVVGTGPRPRHADAELGGNTAANTWTTPLSPTANTPLVRVIQQGWKFDNILFAGPTDVGALNSCVELFRNAAAGDLERDASHASFTNCRFASGYKQINDVGGCYGVLVQGNRFVSAGNYAIMGVGNIGVGQSAWQIIDNQFDEFVNGVLIAGFACVIKYNEFSDGGTPDTTTVLNTSNGGGANNHVIENSFAMADAQWNTPDIVGNATDVWNQNYNRTAVQIGPS